MSEHENAFSGKCPTCGQRYLGNEIERLRAALKEIAELWGAPNDDAEPAREIARKVLNQQITEIDPIEEVQMKDFNSPEEAIAAAKEAIDKHNLMLKRIRASKKSQRTRKAMRLARGK